MGHEEVQTVTELGQKVKRCQIIFFIYKLLFFN